jgi:hypothetical protein
LAHLLALFLHHVHLSPDLKSPVVVHSDTVPAEEGTVVVAQTLGAATPALPRHLVVHLEVHRDD